MAPAVYLFIFRYGTDGTIRYIHPFYGLVDRYTYLPFDTNLTVYNVLWTSNCYSRVTEIEVTIGERLWTKYNGPVSEDPDPVGFPLFHLPEMLPIAIDLRIEATNNCRHGPDEDIPAEMGRWADWLQEFAASDRRRMLTTQSRETLQFLRGFRNPEPGSIYVGLLGLGSMST